MLTNYKCDFSYHSRLAAALEAVFNARIRRAVLPGLHLILSSKISHLFLGEYLVITSD